MRTRLCSCLTLVVMLLSSVATSEEGAPKSSEVLWGAPVNGVRMGVSPLLTILGKDAKDVKITIAFENVGKEAKEIPLYEGSNLEGLAFIPRPWDGDSMKFYEPYALDAFSDPKLSAPKWQRLDPGKRHDQVLALPVEAEWKLEVNQSVATDLCQAPSGTKDFTEFWLRKNAFRCGTIVIVRADAAGKQSGVLLLSVDKKGSYSSEGKPVSLDEVRGKLEEFAKTAEVSKGYLVNRKVFIRAHPECLYKHVQAVMKICLDVKIWDVTFAVSADDATEPTRKEAASELEKKGGKSEEPLK